MALGSRASPLLFTWKHKWSHATSGLQMLRTLGQSLDKGLSTLCALLVCALHLKGGLKVYVSHRLISVSLWPDIFILWKFKESKLCSRTGRRGVSHVGRSWYTMALLPLKKQIMHSQGCVVNIESQPRELDGSMTNFPHTAAVELIMSASPSG